MASMLYSHLPLVVGVVGAGQMGSGIAQLLASKGLDVVLCDKNQEVLERGLGSIKTSLDRFVRKGKLTPGDCGIALDKIKTSTALEVRGRRAAGSARAGGSAQLPPRAAQGQSGAGGSLRASAHRQARAAGLPTSCCRRRPSRRAPRRAAQACKAADFVVEAVSEDEQLKRSIFTHLDKVRGRTGPHLEQQQQLPLPLMPGSRGAAGGLLPFPGARQRTRSSSCSCRCR